VEEQPPLDPAIESFDEEPRPVLEFEFSDVPPPPRTWFVRADGTALLQLQQDRFLHNWRGGGDVAYPRYEAVRHEFDRRFAQLRDFAGEEDLGEVEVRQAELNYVNLIPTGAGRQSLGAVNRIVRSWTPVDQPGLGRPEEVRTLERYRVQRPAGAPARLYLAVSPAAVPDREAPAITLTLTVRGDPADDLPGFLDDARALIVTTFASMTTPQMHEEWGRLQ